MVLLFSLYQEPKVTIIKKQITTMGQTKTTEAGGVAFEPYS